MLPFATFNANTYIATVAPHGALKTLMPGAGYINVLNVCSGIFLDIITYAIERFDIINVQTVIESTDCITQPPFRSFQRVQAKSRLSTKNELFHS